MFNSHINNYTYFIALLGQFQDIFMIVDTHSMIFPALGKLGPLLKILECKYTEKGNTELYLVLSQARGSWNLSKGKDTVIGGYYGFS